MNSKKEILQFQEEVCTKTCVLQGKCIQDGKGDHWFLMCPHYHKWKFGYQSVWETEGLIIKNRQQ